MDIIKITDAQTCVAELKNSIECGLHRVIYMVSDSKYVAVHKQTQIDETDCVSLGYSIYEEYCNGGTAVLNKGDFMFAHFGTINSSWAADFATYFVEWLKSKGINAEFIDNDILVDNYKVCGLGITRYGRIDYTGGFIGINTNLAHIQNLCKKPMKKIPKGLSEYGITTEEIEEMFLNFCSNKL